MKQKLLPILIVVFLYSCSSEDREYAKDESLPFDKREELKTDFKLSKDEAISILHNYVKGDGQTKIKKSNSPLEILDCKETTTFSYTNQNNLKKMKSSFSEAIEGLPLYEFTISEKKDEYGYALVSADKRLDEVLVYVSKGSLSDTIYNKGLAHYMRSLSVINSATIGFDYWQPYVEGATFVVNGSYHFLKYATEQEYYDWPFYDNWDTWQNPCAFVPVQWDQDSPYNNYGPYLTECNQIAKIGCGAVAVAQVMAYHKKPDKYNWPELTRTTKVTNTSNSLQRTQVARLMRDVADAIDTQYRCKSDGTTAGGTNEDRIKIGLEKLGYSCNRNAQRNKMNSDTIYYNILNNYPIICGIEDEITTGGGHLFVIDGAYRKFRNGYYFKKDITDPNNKIFMIYKARQCFDASHYNWGWGGNSDGWYYNTNPYDKPYGWYSNAPKILITRIQYEGL